MRKILIAAALILGALPGQAQEKVMNIQRTDGTISQTRVADMKQISFLIAEESGQGLLVKTLGGETVAVLFETNPVVTASNGKLTVKPSMADATEFEISDIAEIRFGKPSDDTALRQLKGFSCVLQEGGALLRGIPQDTEPRVYSLDGKSLPVPPTVDGELQLSRTTLGSGIYIVKVGTFTAKIQLK